MYYPLKRSSSPLPLPLNLSECNDPFYESFVKDMEIPLKGKVTGIYPVPLGFISGSLVLKRPRKQHIADNEESIIDLCEEIENLIFCHDFQHSNTKIGDEDESSATIINLENTRKCMNLLNCRISCWNEPTSTKNENKLITFDTFKQRRLKNSCTSCATVFDVIERNEKSVKMNETWRLKTFDSGGSFREVMCH